MVNYQSIDLDLTFSALADPTRRAILERLGRGGASVGELAAPHGISPPAISKHLKVLERAGLVRREKRGRVHVLHIEPEPIDRAEHWIRENRRFWSGQLDRLERYLDNSEQGGSNEPDRR
jgi:DNA-binding transcriptional ArsR family regulator